LLWFFLGKSLEKSLFVCHLTAYYHMFVKPCFMVDEDFAVFVSGNHVSDFPGG
jgi:hypothetical protein